MVFAQSEEEEAWASYKSHFGESEFLNGRGEYNLGYMDSRHVPELNSLAELTTHYRLTAAIGWLVQRRIVSSIIVSVRIDR